MPHARFGVEMAGEVPVMLAHKRAQANGSELRLVIPDQASWAAESHYHGWCHSCQLFWPGRRLSWLKGQPAALGQMGVRSR